MTTRAQHRAYNQSEKGKARKKRYDMSEGGREARRLWEREKRKRSGLSYSKQLLVSRRRKALARREKRRQRGQVQDEGRN